MGGRKTLPIVATAVLGLIASAGPSAAATEVSTERDLRRAWANPHTSEIELTRDIALLACRVGAPVRESALPVKVAPRWSWTWPGSTRAEYYFMAFPGEEPPQIECNEDASGESTDE